MDSLSPFLDRSSCSLRKLHLRVKPWHDADKLINLFKETPKLAELTIFAPAGFAITEKLSAKLVCQPSSLLPVLVPHLESLTITGLVTFTPCTSHPLINIIKSRGYEEFGSKIRSPPSHRLLNSFNYSKSCPSSAPLISRFSSSFVRVGPMPVSKHICLRVYSISSELQSLGSIVSSRRYAGKI